MLTFEDKFSLACTLAAGRISGLGDVPVASKDVTFIVKYCFDGLEQAEKELRGEPGMRAV